MSDTLDATVEEEHGHLRSLGEVSDHVFTFVIPSVATSVNTVPAAGTAFGVPLVCPYNMNVIRTWMYTPVASANTSSLPPVAWTINLLRTPVSGAATNLIYNEAAANAPISTTLGAAITSTTATTLTPVSNSGFPGPGGIPFGVVAQGGDAGLNPVVPGAAGYPGPTPPTILIQIDNELMLVTGGLGSPTWTVTRGAFGSTAATHSNGATLNYINRPSTLTGANNNILTTGVSPTLVPFVWNPPENPALLLGDTLQPVSKLVGTATTPGSTIAVVGVSTAVTIEVHCQKA